MPARDQSAYPAVDELIKPDSLAARRVKRLPTAAGRGDPQLTKYL
jgi:hypothetical protein